LFQYLDSDGQAHSMDSGVVNAYLKQACGAEFTAKDYRTWAGSLSAFVALQHEARQGPPDRAIVVQVIKKVAKELNNTPAVCRSCYVHPAIIDAYMSGELPERRPCGGPKGLRADERRLLAFLAGHQAGGNKDC